MLSQRWLNSHLKLRLQAVGAAPWRLCISRDGRKSLWPWQGAGLQQALQHLLQHSPRGSWSPGFLSTQAGKLLHT